ncbi:MAG: twin-arginine translocase TatA/TatE family subunit [Coriobacteriia bacterium]|nr:twin-arginine translocase TatA/TatE family subunit [Coriobacteriia bacterium]
MKILGLGVPELLIILAVALLIFGPKNLPKLGESLGKTVKSIRSGMEDDKDKAVKAEAVEESSAKDSSVVVDDEDADIETNKSTKA